MRVHPLSRQQVDGLLQNPVSRSEVIRQLLSNTTFYQEVQGGMDSFRPPIISDAAFNNQQVNWSQCTRPYPVDQRAFGVYSHGLRMGEVRLGDDKKNSENMECN